MIGCNVSNYRNLSQLDLTSFAVEFDPGCEAMIYSTSGSALQGKLCDIRPEVAYLIPTTGITGGYGGDRRVECKCTFAWQPYSKPYLSLRYHQT